MRDLDRRDFLKFLGATTYSLSSVGILNTLASCQSSPLKNLSGISPTFEDKLILASGLKWEKIISYGDPIFKNETFGFNNDYIAIEPLNNNELLMWVNHEYVNPQFIGGWARTKKNVTKERHLVGGSIIKVKNENGSWKYINGDPANKVVRGDTKIPFNNGVKVKGKDYAIGTLGNCAGGKTPWGTFLTCEENYQDCYGDRNYVTGEFYPSRLKWENYYKNPTEHYGWVVEVDPHSGNAKKHTNLGRFAHECATCVTADAGNVVVYSGDDKKDEFIYKFISKAKDNFDEGVLYVADVTNGKWLPLDLELSPILKKHFKSQIDVLTYPRHASRILGATEMDRPEDFEIHPYTGEIYLTLTNNTNKKNYHGSIFKISETGGDYNSLTFSSENFALGGLMNGFSCPDNLCFDPKGNLWVASDISGSSIGKAPYNEYGNNGLYVIPTSGPKAGIPIQVASAPVHAELTGLCFSPDHKTLFLSVQHPGEKSQNPFKNPTSTWPDGGIPKSSVVAISGPLLEQIVL